MDRTEWNLIGKSNSLDATPLLQNFIRLIQSIGSAYVHITLTRVWSLQCRENTDNPPGWQKKKKKKFIFQLSQKNKLVIFACRKLILMWRRRRDRRLIYCVKYARITFSSNPYFSVYRQNQQFCPHTGKYGSEEIRTLAYLDSDNLARQILKLQYQLWFNKYS